LDCEAPASLCIWYDVTNIRPVLECGGFPAKPKRHRSAALQSQAGAPDRECSEDTCKFTGSAKSGHREVLSVDSLLLCGKLYIVNIMQEGLIFGSTAMKRRYKYSIIVIIPILCLISVLYSLGFRFSPHEDDTIQNAVKHHNLSGLKNFISKTHDIDIRDKNGKTALQIASSVVFDRPITEFIIQNGADVNQVSVDGVPLITEVLCSRKYREKEKMLDLLVKYKADVNKKDIEGNTTIMSAIGEYWCEDIKHFMQYKPDVNVLNNKGESALFIAVVNGSERNAMILLENKANPNFICSARHERILFDKKDHQFCTTGKSLLDIATMMGESGVVSVLKRHGAKTSEELAAQQSPVMPKN